ncbi:arabinose 5-phosphate isomerase [Arenimonas maotaiensis]|jgi:arabinose-5-phosphate isomerase|uniref:Arabinose 5-phosphate isomerase n=1 Tax=Arenimonas maotaiensis TaxID=1446479 RepID=A0A917CF51_9GAMM|nr:KpsF/GutQ family sugar-phosphate isomerase [Arenimonas maotaiensis]GGF86490.1 arabinose 5-phosphate isomerase [Arenimonas maotaiensis]
MTAAPAENVCTDADWIAAGRRVLAVEGRALAALENRLDAHFAEACRRLLACTGRVICTGMGKSGHIANKIAATLASTGTPAFFVHPGEASHGDLGMILDQDVVLALSNSGESDELNMIMPVLKRQGNVIVAMTGRPQSRLAGFADVHLDVSVPEEACPLGLAPTSSTTVSLALGDALAVALLEARGFGAEDFARSHPAGSLGRRLLVRIDDLMHSGDALPMVMPDASVTEALLEMSAKRLGMTAVVDDALQLLGVFTDGDLRRALERGPIDFSTTPVSALMGRQPKTVPAGHLAVEAAHLLEQHRVNGLLVVDDGGRLVGALNIHDLLQARVL